MGAFAYFAPYASANTMISTFLKKNSKNLLSFLKTFVLLQSLYVNNKTPTPDLVAEICVRKKL